MLVLIAYTEMNIAAQRGSCLYRHVLPLNSFSLLARAEKAASYRLYCFGRGHYNSVILIQSDVVSFAVSADDIGVQDERQTFNGGFHFIFKFVAFVDAQPELVVCGSTTTDFNFSDPQEGFVVIVVFREKSFDLFSRLRGEIDSKHEFLQKVRCIPCHLSKDGQHQYV